MFTYLLATSVTHTSPCLDIYISISISDRHIKTNLPSARSEREIERDSAAWKQTCRKKKGPVPLAKAFTSITSPCSSRRAITGGRVDGSPSLSSEVSLAVALSVESMDPSMHHGRLLNMCISYGCSGYDGSGCGDERRAEQPSGLPDQGVQRAERGRSSDLQHRRRLPQLGPCGWSRRRRCLLRLLPYRCHLHGLLRPGQSCVFLIVHTTVQARVSLLLTTRLMRARACSPRLSSPSRQACAASAQRRVISAPAAPASPHRPGRWLRCTPGCS